ncbi:MAG: hypothetical protein OHK0039_08990 [Bacteroidia bacterium]
MKHIAGGESFEGIAWRVSFQTTEGVRYVWEGEFEQRQVTPHRNGLEHAIRLLHEAIDERGHRIAARVLDKVLFDGRETIRLSREKSLLVLLEEDFAIQLKREFSQIVLSDYSQGRTDGEGWFHMSDRAVFDEKPSIDQVRASHLGTLAKLSWAFHLQDPLFFLVRERFIEIFPQVADMKFLLPEGEGFRSLPPEVHDVYIKEQGVTDWIAMPSISSGMMRTLIHLSELYLSAEGTLFLIDEFENSLGVNCIDELTADILQSDRSLQFIITSHHPYIIHAIGFPHWEIVTRTGGVVKTLSATELNLGRSKHDAFMQLLQRVEYQTGTESVRP